MENHDFDITRGLPWPRHGRRLFPGRWPLRQLPGCHGSDASSLFEGPRKIFRRTAKDSMDWIKGKFTGKPHISWENLWFPVDFPLNQSSEDGFFFFRNRSLKGNFPWELYKWTIFFIFQKPKFGHKLGWEIPSSSPLGHWDAFFFGTGKAGFPLHPNYSDFPLNQSKWINMN